MAFASIPIISVVLALVGLGNALAWPVAYALMRRWLENFEVRVAVGAGTLLLSTTLSLTAAVAVMAGLTVRTVRKNPAVTLRHE